MKPRRAKTPTLDHGRPEAPGVKPAAGYSASGEGEYSRHASSPGNIKLRGYTEGVPGSGRRYRRKTRHDEAFPVVNSSQARRGPRSLADNIKYNEVEISRMERAAAVETNPVRLAKLRKNIEIKSRFVEKLKSQREEREDIVDIYGDDPLSFIPWDRL